MNNMFLVHGFLNFNDPDLFYFIQILKRKEEHPNLTANGKLIADFHIHSYNDMNKEMAEIISICDKEDARAYIRLNRRSMRKTALLVNAEIARRLSLDDYHIKNIYQSILGKHHAEKDNTWLIDIDDEQVTMTDEVKQLALTLQKDGGRDPMCIRVPTKKGLHLITRPFNVMKFQTVFPEIIVHKDNPTLLYWKDKPTT